MRNKPIKLKHSFLCKLSAWVNTCIREESNPLIDFVDWVGLLESEGGFFCSFF